MSPVHFGSVTHSGKQILLQVVFLTPCVHDHVTTPTRGWWKITSLQATGKMNGSCGLSHHSNQQATCMN